MFSSPLYIFDLFTQKQIFPFCYHEQKDLLHKNRLYRRETAGLVASEGFAYIFVKIVAGPHRYQAKVNLYHHKKTRVSKLLISIFSTTIS